MDRAVEEEEMAMGSRAHGTWGRQMECQSDAVAALISLQLSTGPKAGAAQETMGTGLC